MTVNTNSLLYLFLLSAFLEKPFRLGKRMRERARAKTRQTRDLKKIIIIKCEKSYLKSLNWSQ